MFVNEAFDQKSVQNSNFVSSQLDLKKNTNIDKAYFNVWDSKDSLKTITLLLIMIRDKNINDIDLRNWCHNDECVKKSNFSTIKWLNEALQNTCRTINSVSELAGVYPSNKEFEKHKTNLKYEWNTYDNNYEGRCRFISAIVGDNKINGIKISNEQLMQVFLFIGLDKLMDSGDNISRNKFVRAAMENRTSSTLLEFFQQYHFNCKPKEMIDRLEAYKEQWDMNVQLSKYNPSLGFNNNYDLLCEMISDTDSFTDHQLSEFVRARNITPNGGFANSVGVVQALGSRGIDCLASLINNGNSLNNSVKIVDNGKVATSVSLIPPYDDKETQLKIEKILGNYYLSTWDNNQNNGGFAKNVEWLCEVINNKLITDIDLCWLMIDIRLGAKSTYSAKDEVIAALKLSRSSESMPEFWSKYYKS